MSNAKKIVLLGAFNVGKSSLIRRFVQNVFTEDYLVTIGVHILKKTIITENVEQTLVIWDIEGKEDVQEIRHSYLQGSSGFIYVIDPTRIHTYQNLTNELKFITKNYPKTPVITVANKSDLINIEDFQKQLIDLNITIDYTTSAKIGNNVELIFKDLAGKIF